MSAPKEPGHPGNGPAKRETPGAAPPWQRAGQARPSGPNQPGHSPGVDERLRRFVSGGDAPGAPAGQPPAPAPAKPAPAPAPAKPATAPAAPVAAPAAAPASPPAPAPKPAAEDAYGSELPDLSESAKRRAPVRRPQVTAGPRGPVRATMQIRRIDPWSALKVSLLLSTALFFVWMIAVAVLYVMLGAMGVWSKLNSNVGDLLTNNSAAELVSGSSIFGAAALIGLVNIVVLTAMATLGVVIYNLSTDVVGGVEVTLADLD